MVPPVFAYWGAIQTDLELQRQYLVKAYEQLRLYRDHLRDPNSNGLWQHVVMGSWSDVNHWSESLLFIQVQVTHRAPVATGQGWAASGMIRVYQTIAKSPLRDELSWALADLSAWAQEIVGAVWDHQRADGSLGNYLRDDSFMDMSGTAFMAAVTYRLGVITDVASLIPNADKAFALVKNSIAADGRLQNVVNPYDFSTQYYDVSPEGQAMVLMCQAAWRDYTAFTSGIHHSLADVVRFYLSLCYMVSDSLASSPHLPRLSLPQRPTTIRLQTKSSVKRRGHVSTLVQDTFQPHLVMSLSLAIPLLVVTGNPVHNNNTCLPVSPLTRIFSFLTRHPLLTRLANTLDSRIVAGLVHTLARRQGSFIVY